MEDIERMSSRSRKSRGQKDNASDAEAPPTHNFVLEIPDNNFGASERSGESHSVNMIKMGQRNQN